MNNINKTYFSVEFKPFKLIPYKPHQSLLGKHVEWLKQERHGLSNIGVVALFALEATLLTLSGIGIILLAKGIHLSNRMDAEAHFYSEATKAKKPAEGPIDEGSKTATCNHTHDFTISDHIIWYRKRNEKDEWHPMFFDGYPDKIPTEIDCDGANLAVVDQDRVTHYKKVLAEYRSTEVTDQNKKAQEAIAGEHVDLKKDSYIAIDKTGKNNWKDKWFSLPYIHVIVNLFAGKRLQIPANAKAWAISHRGRYNNYLDDAVGQHHEVATGVTTLYVLEKSGDSISKYDPWSPKNAKMSIPLPQTATSTYVGENMKVAASTLMTIGYETEKNPLSQEITKKLVILTTLADIDSQGWNPGLKYGYEPDPKDKDVRVIPLPSWEKHPIELKGKAALTSAIEIFQTGEGNHARLLRVDGLNEVGEKGRYYKTITEKEWHFQKFEWINKEHEFLLQTKPADTFTTTVHDYMEGKLVADHSSSTDTSNSLKNFGKNSLTSKIKMNVDGDSVEFTLYKRKSLRNFLGFEGDSYDLVASKEAQKKEHVKKWFHGKNVIQVNVKENKDTVTIAPKQWFGKDFTFIFRQST